ncbi:MAG TPA: type II toxin-antitoxin system VapC family toxin [Polyangiaceae bacterium]|nr:type II toxin-antitoxin system VapC family toxin [Polyangiaceae bacterium]
MIVLDTHALLWWALDPDKLSSEALRVVTEMELRGGFASSISLWEIGIKAKRGKLELPIGIEELARRIERGGVVELVPVDTGTWLRSLTLVWDHSDPADRVIAATAMMRGVPVLTKDAAMHSFRELACVW